VYTLRSLQTAMALSEVTSAFLKRFRPTRGHLQPVWAGQCRYASTDVTVPERQELETTGFVDGSGPSPKDLERFDPAGVAKKRNRRLPPSRYA
jgi:large subunit ribosomal protein L5